ncbi:MAG: hypothetical protein KKB85_03070, partial [Candidatus Altiarchaeota archaeon]|nr:hypothetical protein [Candidatus Altiarchaeota archaeon]
MDEKQKQILIGILLFGSIWGMFEATLGVFLHMIHFMLKGAIMFSLGAFLMSAALRTYRPRNRIGFLLGLGAIASLLKGFDIFIVGPGPMVFRPMISILIEAMAFGAVLTVIDKIKLKAPLTHLSTGAGFAYFSYLGFGLVFKYLGIGSNFWLSMSLTDMMNFILADGTQAALLSAVTVMAGYRTGDIIALIQKKAVRSGIFYELAALLTGLCWL